ncbi:putative reverse transcriptase domain-containing protein, partial [Tanacetum coccineum]
MSPFLPKKFRIGVTIATGRKGYYKPRTRAWVSRVSRKICIPTAMYPCRVEERLTIELVEGREVEKIVTTVTKNGVVTRYPGKFHEYQLTDKEKEIKRMMIYWERVEYEVSDDDDSDLKSTARSVPKDYELEDTGFSSKLVRLGLNFVRMVQTRTNDNENGQPDIATIIAQQLQNIIPQIITQATNNMNNGNNNNNNGNNNKNGNGGNNGCSYKGFQVCGPKEYDGKGGAIALTRWIEKMENVLDNNRCSENQKVKYAASSFVNKALTWYIAGLTPEIRGMLKANQPTTIENAILRAGILIDEAISCGTLSKSNEKRKAVEEDAKSEGLWRDKKKAKVERDGVCRLCFNCQKPGHFAKDYRASYSSDHLRNTYPKLNRTSGQAGNPLALEGNRKNRNNGNQTRGRAYNVNVNVNAAEASWDPKVVTGTFSLNNYFATVLFDSGAD